MIFSNTLLNEAIEILVSNDIEITIKKETINNVDKIGFDLGTYAKSSAFLVVEEENVAVAYLRYNEEITIKLNRISSVDDLLTELIDIVKSCIHGRGFVAPAWNQFARTKDISLL